MDLQEAADKWGAYDPRFEDWLPHQLPVFEAWEQCESNRMLVFYPTGTGKTKIMLTMMALRGETDVLVIAPPITHAKWVSEGKALGITVTCISHAKWRQSDFNVTRKQALIVDEFHLLGGQTGKGWVKLDRKVRGMTGPVILGSATPNYNDAERCYCLVHVLNPELHDGGFLAFLYRHCVTVENPFRKTPDVERFLLFDSAADFLAAQPNVVYMPDDAPDITHEVEVGYEAFSWEFERLHVDRTRGKIMSSLMEIKQRTSLLKILTPDEKELTMALAERLGILDGDGISPRPVILFAQRTTVSEVLRSTFERGYEGATDRDDEWYWSHGYIDGSMSTEKKFLKMQEFIDGKFRVLIGTASMATGPDGIDKMCKDMIIVDDTEDDSLRRQLIGRVLPRGVVAQEDYDDRHVYILRYDEVN
jgi:superfamily II DNA or RNA helicase